MKIKYGNDKLKSAMKLLLGSGALWVVLSFIIPSVIMTLAFKKSEIHPFGDNQMLVVDLWHQYYPFFKVVREKLLSGASFLYSWETGVGTNFLSLISYYAASPLNLLSVFADEAHIRDALTFILIAKIGFCGAFFSMFLKYTFKRNDVSITVFSTLFALCSYMLGYYWNVMWFDTIALFPLVMLGVCAMCREGKWKLFTISLALSLISNYYIGYFTCIFTIFAFACAIICEGKGIKDFFKKLWLIVRSSALGIALGGFILLPAYYGLQLTYSVNNIFPTEATFYEKWTTIFGNMLSYSEPAMKEGLPNFACGMLGLILLGVFLVSPKIRIREKVFGVLLLGLLAVSCNLNILNYIWHGFHITNMIPYRFAFIFSFILIAAAYRAFDIMMQNGIKIYQLIAMPLIPALIVWFCSINNMEAVKAAMDGENNYVRRSVIISAVFIFIFIVIKLVPLKAGKLVSYITSVMLGITVCSECYSNAVLGVKKVGNSSYSTYPTKNNGVQLVLDDIEAADPSLFYRSEMTKTYTLNDGALYGYNGVSQFSSAANVDVTRLMRKLGLYGSEAGNRYYYRISSPVTNALLGIKYIISKDGLILNDPMSLVLFGDEDGVCAYKNVYSLSLGFMMNDNILAAGAIDSKCPYDYENEVIRLATGINADIYTPQPVVLAEYNGLTVDKKGYGTYSFIKDDLNSSDASVTYTYDGVSNAALYGYVSNGGFDTISVNVGERRIDSGISVSDYSIAFPMGGETEGEQVSLKITAKNDVQSGTGSVMVYSLDKALWEEAYGLLADEQLELTEFSDSKMTGTLTAKEDGILYLSIPYEEGWSVYVDGEKTETFAVMGAMTGAAVSAGEHTIKLVYIPKGFKAGMTATVAAAVCFIGLTAFEIYRKKKKKNDTDPDPTNEPEKTEPVADGEETSETKPSDLATENNSSEESSVEEVSDDAKEIDNEKP